MRVAEFASLTGPSGVAITHRDDPEPSPEEALVDVHATSLNRHDLRVLQNKFDYVDGSQVPFVSGLDLADEVRAVGRP